MDITFASKKLKKLCDSESKLRGDYGYPMAKKIQTRLLDMRAAENLETMRNLPGRCHELNEDWKGHLAVDLVHPQRLIFSPNHDPVPRNDAGALIWEKVSKLIVVAIKDYH